LTAVAALAEPNLRETEIETEPEPESESEPEPESRGPRPEARGPRIQHMSIRGSDPVSRSGTGAVSGRGSGSGSGTGSVSGTSRKRLCDPGQHKRTLGVSVRVRAPRPRGGICFWFVSKKSPGRGARARARRCGRRRIRGVGNDAGDGPTAPSSLSITPRRRPQRRPRALHRCGRAGSCALVVRVPGLDPCRTF
jgi:hypothetical protein